MLELWISEKTFEVDYILYKSIINQFNEFMNLQLSIPEVEVILRR